MLNCQVLQTVHTPPLKLSIGFTRNLRSSPGMVGTLVPFVETQMMVSYVKNISAIFCKAHSSFKSLKLKRIRLISQTFSSATNARGTHSSPFHTVHICVRDNASESLPINGAKLFLVVKSIRNILHLACHHPAISAGSMSHNNSLPALYNKII